VPGGDVGRVGHGGALNGERKCGRVGE
jgi:hypothetical protein